MDAIAYDIPRTMNAYIIQSKNKARLEIEQDILDYHAKGETITHIDQGVGAHKQMPGKEYHAKMGAVNTEANKAKKAQISPIRR